jgi:hypothetical protein
MIKRKIAFIGRTKDGDYAAHKELNLLGADENVFTIPKVITENGYINITIQLDAEGRLDAVMVERWDPTIL